MKQTKKIVAIGLSLSMVLSPLPVSATESVEVDRQREDSEWISEQSEESESGDLEKSQLQSEEAGNDVFGEPPVQTEETDNKEFEDGLEQSEEIESKELEEFSTPAEESESQDQGEISTQSEGVVASGKCGENITFNLTRDGVLTLSGSGPMPEIQYDWKAYKPICGWGDWMNSIKKIVIGDGITSISRYSFYECWNLTEVSIPESVKWIGYEAFAECNNINAVMIDGLESWCSIEFEDVNSNPLQYGAALYINGVKETQIIIPDGITEIKPYAFGINQAINDSRSVITSVQLPDTVVSIGDNAFAYNHLQSINIPDSVTKIGTQALAGNDFSEIEISKNVSAIDNSAFKDCKKLQRIGIPDSVKELGADLFDGCIKLTEVALPQEIDTIGEAMFAGCTSLRKFKIPDTVQVIGNNAFASCSNLADIELPDQIQTIGDYAFFRCYNLKEVELPTKLTHIGNAAFMECKALSEVNIPGTVTSIGSQAFRMCESLSKITMPDTITEIGGSAFSGCCMLEQFKIPESTEAIQDYTFSGCVKLSSVTLSENITAIGTGAFNGCEMLESITLPSQISIISAYTFSGCKSLKTIQIPENVTDIGGYAFKNCSNLKRIDFKGNAPSIGTAFEGVTAECYYPAGNTTYTLEITTQDFGGDLTWTYEGKTDDDKYKCGTDLTWNLTEDGKLVITGSGRMFDYSIEEYKYAPWYEERTKINSIEIDDNVTYIGNYAFYHCYKITEEKTKLPANLEEIGEGAFKNCAIKSTDIPEKVSKVGKEAFAYSGLISVSLPAGLQYLPERMFYESHKLYDVVFSEGLKEIGDEAFGVCVALKSVEIPEGVTTIGNSAFVACGAYKSYGAVYSGCYSFQKVTLPSTLTTLGKRAFAMCQCLKSINIPESVTEIKSATFDCCYELCSITIPKNIKKIEIQAFNQNTSLKTIIFSWNAPQIDSKAFDGGRGSSRDVTATCYYPSNNPAWTSSMLQDYGGKLTWVAREMVKPSEGTESGAPGGGGKEDGTGESSSGSGSGTGTGSGSGTGTGSGTGSGSGSGTGTGSGTGSSSGESGNTGGTETEKQFGFSAHSLTLKGDIGVNFYLELDDAILNDSNAMMEIEVGGAQKKTIKISDAVKNGFTEVKDANGDSHQCYKFTYNLYAKQMTDNIVATLKTSSGTWKEVYSVQNYIKSAQNSSNEKLKNLVNAMAVYGGYAQMLFGYNTNNLAGSSLGDVSMVTKDMLSEYEYTEDGEEENLKFYGTSLLLKEQTAIRVYYQLTKGDIKDYEFTIDGKTVNPVQSGNDDIYYVELNNIAAQDLEVAHVFKAGNIIISNYSALSYVNKALDSEKSSENNKKTAAALYLYWNAAEAYFS